MAFLSRRWTSCPWRVHRLDGAVCSRETFRRSPPACARPCNANEALGAFRLHLVPQFVELLQRRAAHLQPALFGELFDFLKSPHEFQIRPLERLTGLDAVLAREVHGGEQQVSDLFFYSLPSPRSLLLFQL